MWRIDDGKENVFNRGDPVSGLISRSNNESQEVSRGHSSVDVLGNQERAKDRTVNQLKYNPTERCGITLAERGTTVPSGRYSRKARKQRMQQKLLESIIKRDNLNLAYKQVVRNKGAAGVDGMECVEMLSHLRENGTALVESIRNQSYKPMPVRQVEIPKPDGSMRKLGIPTVTDRVVQQATAQMLVPIYEETFHNNSYGFRTGKSAQQAVIKAVEYMNSGYNWVVDIDLEKFFDKVNHDKLISILNKKIKDGRVLSLIRSFLKSGVMVGEAVEDTDLGTPQGGNLSPLLANVILNELDWELDRRGLHFARYADDCIILVRSQKAAFRVMESVTHYIENKLLLKVNRLKSKIGRPTDIKYLGFGFYMRFKDKEYRAKPHEKSVTKVIQKLKQLTCRAWGVSNSYKVQKIAEVLKGWINYYKIGAVLTVARKLDKVIRYRLRMCIWKHWKNPHTRYKNLVKLGVNKANAASAAGSHGYARICRTESVCYAMSNARLERFGLISAEKYFLKVAC